MNIGKILTHFTHSCNIKHESIFLDEEKIDGKLVQNRNEFLMKIAINHFCSMLIRNGILLALLIRNQKKGKLHILREFSSLISYLSEFRSGVGKLFLLLS